jgi:hypothetical protein
VFAAVRWSEGCERDARRRETGCKWDARRVSPAGDQRLDRGRRQRLACALGSASLHLDEQRHGRRILGVGHDQNLIAKQLAMSVQYGTVLDDGCGLANE